MVMGAVMLGGIITGKPPVTITQATPIARLTSEYNVFVLPENSPFKTMKDVVEAMKKDPASVKWGGGSRGSTEHIAAAMIAREVGVDASKINYVPFRGGGEATAAILGGNVTVGGSGYSEFQQYIEAGQDEADRCHLRDAPQGHQHPDAEGAGHQRRASATGAASMRRPASPTAQRQGADRHGHRRPRAKAWTEALEKNNWTPALLTGKAFEDFVDADFASLRATMVKSGMI